MDKTKAISRLSIFIPLAIGLIFSVLIPPFQSPDEFAHLKRAYLLSKWHFFLSAPPGKSTGGPIDRELKTYKNCFNKIRFHPEVKCTLEILRRAQRCRWSGEMVHMGTPGSNVYFPLCYTPQAIGLKIGETLGLTVSTSCLLARLFSVAAVSLILYASFMIYPVSPLTVGLLLMPMSVFQLSTANLDGVATALTILYLSAFFAIHDADTPPPHGLFCTLCVSSVLIVCCRVNLFPLLAMLAYTCHKATTPRRWHILGGIIATCVLWTAFVATTTVDYRNENTNSAVKTTLFYLGHPLTALAAVVNTIANPLYLKSYAAGFIGLLGWGETPFIRTQYYFMAACLVLIALMSIPKDFLEKKMLLSLSVGMTGLCCAGLIFAVIMVSWNPCPAKIIEGIQGRYFLLPMLFVSYAVSGNQPFFSSARRACGSIVLLVFAAYSLVSTTQVLLLRYYL